MVRQKATGLLRDSSTAALVRPGSVLPPQAAKVRNSTASARQVPNREAARMCMSRVGAAWSVMLRASRIKQV
jgi:hypothetical protein